MTQTWRCGTCGVSEGYGHKAYCRTAPMSTPTNPAPESAGGERHGSCCHAPEYDHHERRPDCDGTGDKYDLPCFGQHHPFVAETPSPEVGMRETVARSLVTALYLYPHYRVDSRGPLGCIYDALEAVAPDVLADCQNLGLDEAYRKHFGDEDASILAAAKETK